MISPETLQAWGSKTLAERAVLFHRRFGEVKVSPYTIRNVYRQHNIKRKCLKYVKTLRYQNADKLAAHTHETLMKVQKARDAGRRVIFTDEAMFTSSSLGDRAYAPPRDNITLSEKLLY